MAKINGTASGDVLVGTARGDEIRGRGGADTLLGFGGRDHLFGGSGNDTYDGATGDDVFYGGGGRDFFFGGSGDDTLTYADFARGIRMVAGGVIAQDFSAAPSFDGARLKPGGISSVETLIGTDHADRLAVGNAFATVYGGRGDDYIVSDGTVHGDQGSDMIQAELGRGGRSHDLILAATAFGGKGRDRLVADTTDATLYGGRGGDTFIFHDGPADSVIRDFDPAQGDGLQFMLPDGPSAFPFTDFAGLLAAATDVGDDLRIAWTDGSVTILGLQTADLQEDWFDFRPEVWLF